MAEADPGEIAQLRRSEARYHALFDALDEGFCVIEMLFDAAGGPADYRFLQINAAFEEQTGLHDAVGRRMREMAPDHEQHWFDIYGRIALTGEPARFEQRADALGRWYDVYAFRIDAPEDRHIAILFRDILPRKRTEAALLESNELLRTTFDSSLQLVQLFKAVRDGNGAIVDFEWALTNKRWDERYGSNIGKRLLTENPGVVETGIWAKFLDVMASGESVTHELFYRHEQFDGWFLQTIAKADDGILLSSLDITDRKRAEIALGDSEEKYRTIFQSIDEGFALIEVVLDDAGKPVDLLHLETNPVYERHTGLHDVVGKRIFEIVPDFDAKWLDFYGEIARTGEAARTEYYVAAPLDRWFTLHASRVGGAGSRKIATVFNDITQRKHVEEALGESEEKYRTLFEAMPQGYIEIELMRDESGRAIDIRYLEMNPAFERIFGIPVADAVGRTALDVFPGAEQSWFDIYDRIARSGRAERFEHELGPTNGWYAVDVHPHPRDGDRLLILYEDITERKRAEAVLRDSEERQAFLLTLSDTLRLLRDAVEIQRAATRLLGEHLAVNRAGYYEVGSDQNTFFLTAGWECGLPPLPNRMRITDFGEEIGEGYRAGRTMVMRDTEREAGSDDNLEAVRAIDVRAWIGVPLVKDGRWVAAVGVHSAVPRDWTPAEIALVEEVGERIWAAAERARTEAALAEREEQLALAVDIGAIGHWSYDLATGELTSSAVCRRNFGRPEDVAFTYDELVASIHPDDRERQEQAVAAAAESHTPLHIEYRLFTPGGELRWIEVRGQFVDGNRHSLIGVSQNITERKRAEEALRDSEERQRLMLQLAPALLWSADPAGHEITLNERWADYTGQSEAEAQNFGWLDAIHPDDLPATRAAFEHAFATGEPVEREHRVHKAGNGYRWHLVRHEPVRDDRGTIVRWFGAAIDIDEMKHARQALRESELWLQTLMQGVPQLVWRAVDGGHWTWASPQWSAYTGQAERDSHGWGWLDPVHPDDRERTREVWAGAVGRGEFTADYRLCHAEEGRYRWFQTRALPVRDESGRIVEWLGTSTDVDDLREMQERQHVLVAELQHRVRNILTVVRSVFGRTVEAGGSPEEIADHFRGRLDALARTQVITTRTVNGTADLENLIRDELLSVGVSDGPHVTIEGPDVDLPAKTAESIGLAIHELITNALKYGAIKVPGASLSITWSLNIGYRGARRLHLTWREQGVPALAVTPTRHGFGSELITEALPYRLGAETKLEFLGGGIRCTIDVPLSESDGAADGA